MPMEFVFIIGMAVLLILLNTTCGMLLPEDSPIMTVFSFVGDSNIALAIGAVLGIITLDKRLGGKVIIDVMDKTLKDAGPIVFITSAGGALGQVLKVSGAGARLCCHVNDSYFWVYTNCMGYDMKTGLKTLSISNVVMSLGGLAATFICSLWL